MTASAVELPPSFRSRGFIKSGPKALLGFNIFNTGFAYLNITKLVIRTNVEPGRTARESSKTVYIAKMLLNSFALSILCCLSFFNWSMVSTCSSMWLSRCVFFRSIIVFSMLVLLLRYIYLCDCITLFLCLKLYSTYTISCCVFKRSKVLIVMYWVG